MVTATSKLQILLDVVAGQATKDIKKFSNATKESGKAADKAAKEQEKYNQMISRAKQAALGAGVAILASIAHLTKQGIEANKTKKALEAYAGSAEEAERAIQMVQAATGGAVSKMDAARGAARLLAMGLARNAREAAQLSRIAVTLGATMGKGPVEAFEEFALLLANQSTPRLDTFGISADFVKKRIDELTEADENLGRQQAFVNAVMEDAEGKLLDLENAGFRAASSIDRFEVVLQDTKDTAAEFFADGLMPIIDGHFTLVDALEDVKQEAFATSESYDEFRGKLTWLQRVMGRGSEEEWAEAKRLQAIQLSADEAGESFGHAATLVDGWSSALGLSEPEIEGVIELTDELANEKLAALREELSELNRLIDGRLGRTIDTFNDRQRDLQEEIDEVQGRIDDLNAKPYLTKDQEEELEETKERLGGLKEQYTENADEHEIATKRILLDMLMQRAAMDELTSEELALLNSVAESWGLIDEATAATTEAFDQALLDLAEGKGFDDVQEELDRILGLVESAEGTKDITFRIKVRGAEGIPSWALGHDVQLQHGGPVSPGRAFLVGERGPEMFVPATAGSIVPHNQTTNNFNMTVNTRADTEPIMRDFEFMRALVS